MKQSTSFLTRCLALVLALVLVVSSANLGLALKALAADDGEVISVGTVVANNYDLTEAEAALLKSGYLTGGSITYTAPTDSKLVTIDTKNAKITAKASGEWVATTVKILVDGEEKATVELNDGEGTYDPAVVGEVFSVDVTYVLNKEIAEETQKALLNAAAYLKQGIANGDAAYSVNADLPTVVEAIDLLKMLAEQYGFASEDAATAVAALEKQVNENGGALTLESMNAAYKASASKIQYLAANGAAYKAEIISLYNNLNAIAEDNIMTNGAIDEVLVAKDNVEGTSYAKLWSTFKEILGDVVAALAAPAADAWSMLTTNVLAAEGVDYVKLDELVAAVEETSTPAVVNPLLVATTSVKANVSMQDVTVKVVLKSVAGVDSTELTETVVEKILTLKEGLTAEEVAAAVKAAGIEADALAGWTAYAADGYAATYSELPAKLTAATTYTITYAPVNCAVSIEWNKDLTSVPYGYRMTLPAHEDTTKAYDYTVNGEYCAQGSIATITGETVISRAEGKAYKSTTLYAVVGECYGNAVAQAILSSGVLKGDEVIVYRAPDESDADDLLNLEKDILEAKTGYASNYKGYTWAPYSYGDNGSENLFNGNTAAWTGKQAAVVYGLTLEHVSAEETAEILALAKTLKEEAADQKAAMDRLNGYYSDIEQLNATMLNTLKKLVKGSDFTPGDGPDGEDDYEDDKNVQIQTDFMTAINAIQKGGMDATGTNLALYGILTTYQASGLSYYYQASEEIIAQVELISENLSLLLVDDEHKTALANLMKECGYGHYADKIVDLSEAMAEINDQLQPTNAAIDTTKSLTKLVDALLTSGDAGLASENTVVGKPIITSDVLTTLDKDRVTIKVIVDINGKTVTLTPNTDGYEIDTVVSADMINSLEKQIAEHVSKTLGEKEVYYSCVTDGKLADLLNTKLGETVTLTYTYSPIKYTVHIAGQEDQIITVEDREINLVNHENHPSNVNIYYIDADVVDTTYNSQNVVSSYTFSVEQLGKLFKNGEYTVKLETLNQAEIVMNKLVASLTQNGNVAYFDKDGNLVVTVSGDAEGVKTFVNGLIESGLGYVGMNGEPFFYATEDGTEICLQTLIDAFLHDANFSNEMLIELGKNNGGTVLTTDLQLGVDADTLYFSEKNMILNVEGLPSQAVTGLSYLEKVQNYVAFYSVADEGHLAVELTLPEKVYEAYLTALLATNEVDKADMNAVDSYIATMFLYDYISLVAEDDTITSTTYQNTLEILDELVNKHSSHDIPDWDLTKYEDHYQILRKVYNGITIDQDADHACIEITGSGVALLAAIEDLGYSLDKYDLWLSMVKEFNDDEAELTAHVDGTLTNTNKDFEAAILDIRASGDNKVETIAKKFDYTDDLCKRVESLAGGAVIVLLDDVTGDLSFDATTVLDLNGKTITGNITSNGKLYIVDSTMDTYDCGTVNGKISGNVVITGGNYTNDVTAYLPDGYTMDGTTVKNAVYYIDGETNEVVINSAYYTEAYVNGYLPNVKAVAADIAVDLVANYYACAAVSVDGAELYDIELVDDLLCLLNRDVTGTELVNDLLDCLKPGCNTFINAVIDDLMDFAAIEAAATNGTAIASYEITTAAWAVELKHTSDDHFDIGIGSNEENGKTFTVNLVLDGENAAYVAQVAHHLDAINGLNGEESDVYVHIEKPYYENKTLYVAGSALVKVRADLTVNEKYVPVLVTALSYVLPEKAEALNAALDNELKLKELIDEITIEEIVTAIKTKSENVTFAEMYDFVMDKLPADLAASLEAKLPADSAKLEKAYDLIVKAAGKALDKVNELTEGVTIGDFDKDNDGIYEYATSITKNPDITRRGYTVDALIDSVDVDIKVKIFDVCLWGDADHDGDVDQHDAALVMQYYLGTLDEDQYFCLKRTDVDGNGVIDQHDASLIAEHYLGLIDKFPVEG